MGQGLNISNTLWRRLLWMLPTPILLILLCGVGLWGWSGQWAWLGIVIVTGLPLLNVLVPMVPRTTENNAPDPRLRALRAFETAARHDLHEPLRKITSFGERLEIKQGDKLDENGRLYLSRMVDAAGRMRTLIDDLQDFSRTVSSPLEEQEVDLGELMQAVVSDLQSAIQENDAEIRWDNLPRITGDAACLHLCLLNLAGNAVKFHREGEAPRLYVSVERDADGLHLDFTDHGIGFEPRYKDRIFALFERLHGRDVYAGSGVGLALCRTIAERHGGTLDAESQPGEGAKFRLSLPRGREILS